MWLEEQALSFQTRTAFQTSTQNGPLGKVENQEATAATQLLSTMVLVNGHWGTTPSTKSGLPATLLASRDKPSGLKLASHFLCPVLSCIHPIHGATPLEPWLWRTWAS